MTSLPQAQLIPGRGPLQFTIPGHPFTTFRLLRGQAHPADAPAWVQAIYKGRKHWFVPV